MYWVAVHMHGAGAAIAGVTALFYAEHTKLAQKSSEALAGARLGFPLVPVHLQLHAANSARISSPNT
jgi:hypothetical protein